MAYASASGGYITPAKPKTPRLASAMSRSPVVGGGTDAFGLRQRGSVDFENLFPQPRRYTPPQPQKAAPARVYQMRAPVDQTPTVNTTFTQPQAGQGQLYDLNTDPALQQVYAYTGRADEDARAQANADRSRLIEQAGLPDLAAALGLGSSVADVARANPFSSAANLRHSYELAAEQLAKQNQVNRETFDEQANAANLFFSGYRQQELARLADAFATAQAENTRGYQGGLSDLSSTVQDRVAAIGSALAQALAGSQADRIRALQEARDRRIQTALAAGWTFGGFDANGEPILTPPAGGSSAPAPPPSPALNVGISTPPAAPPMVGTTQVFDERPQLALALSRALAGQLQRRGL